MSSNATACIPILHSDTEDGSDAARIALTLQSLPKAQQHALSQLAIFPSVFDERGAAQVGAMRDHATCEPGLLHVVGVACCLSLPGAGVAVPAALVHRLGHVANLLAGWLTGWLPDPGYPVCGWPAH